MTVARERFEAVAADGWRLRGVWVIPPEPRAVAVVGHAMMVDRRTLDRPRGGGVVSHLAAGGVAVLCPDLRGHGESGPRAEEGGDWSYDDLVADVPVLVGAARARFAGLPLATIGHSLFGHVTLAHLAQAATRGPATAVDRHVMLACNVANPTWRRHRLSRLSKVAAIELAHLVARVVGRAPVRRVGAGSNDEARSYVHDFARTARSCRWQSRDGFDWWAALPAVQTPVLSLVGAGDRLYSPPAEAQALVAPLPHHRFEVVGRASGLGFDPGHMELILDERCRPAWDRALTFVLARP